MANGAQALIMGLLVAIGVLGGIAITQYTAVDQTAGGFTTEEVSSGSVGSIVSLNNSTLERAFYGDTVTVTNTTSGQELTRDDDFAWYTSNGTLKVLSSQAASTTLSVEYQYGTPDETQSDAIGIVSDSLGVAVYLPLVFIVAAILIAVGLFGVVS